MPTPIDREKLLSLSVMGPRRKTVREGRTDTGERYRSVVDDNNTVITERAGTGTSGVSAAQDVLIRPKIVNLEAPNG